MGADERCPTTPLDEIYAVLLREQPDNELLWERIVARAKTTPPDARKGGKA
jgi:hypothetical protein